MELVYLIASSCFTVMSRLKVLQHEKNKESEYENLIEGCVSRGIAHLYKVVSKKWEGASAQLTEVESKIFNSLFDKFKKVVRKESADLKDKFMTGI